MIPGRKTPHNVCHLDLPTVSLLIRTHPKKHFGPQWNYFPPGVAANYGIAEPVFRKSVAALRLLSKGPIQQFRKAFAQHLSESRPEQLLFTLIKMIDIVFEPQFVDVVHDVASTNDPVLQGIIEAAVYYRAIETIKSFRHRTELSWEERIALSVVGSSFDAESVAIVSNSLAEDDLEINVLSLLQELRNKSSIPIQRMIDNTLTLFELEC